MWQSLLPTLRKRVMGSSRPRALLSFVLVLASIVYLVSFSCCYHPSSVDCLSPSYLRRGADRHMG
ncbi:hypothetical protein BDV98DRAFT_569975 [Pterulicium gracile]|uniref:Uncharacterized protein n=1 Tax=Pterulicium gracile TaxID=1884261 RepID=A0A5C3QEG8_9AGAR|nr:hypothetical protein BDV98DRAFT_569975 [Pterula gracilis]